MSEVIKIRQFIYENKDNPEQAIKLISDFINDEYVMKSRYDYAKEQLETIHRNVNRNILGNMDYGNEMGH